MGNVEVKEGRGFLTGRHEIMKYRKAGRGNFGWD
jgi:hypothetical protein